MRNIRILPALFLTLGVLKAQAGSPEQKVEIVNVPVGLSSKILSGRLLQNISEKTMLVKEALLSADSATATVLLYFQEHPTTRQQDSLRSLGVHCYWESWIPPVENHPYGFVVATMPVKNFVGTLSLGFLARMETAEFSRSPKNNVAAHTIGADSVWARGWTGTGVRVGVLDSGLDDDPSNPDLPGVIAARDYSNYPHSIGTSVVNHVTGHGTHVTATILGRGTRSSLNSENGGGPFKGMAPGAGLIFMKIGNDTTGNSQTAGDIAAMTAAVDTFHANVLSMSYGGWDTYHDGSDPEDQAVDAVYAKGVAFFIAAGNEGASARHYSGTLNGSDSTGFIEVDVTGATTNGTKLQFNLIWRPQQGGGQPSLALHYYDGSQRSIASTPLPSTKSVRGTSSQYSQVAGFLPAGNGKYFLKVVNLSASPAMFHIYEDWGDRKVSFASPDPSYTIDEPATADHAIAVGAFVSRKDWTAYDGMSYHFGSTSSTALGDIASFSSRGPRVDGMVKPDIAAPGTALISLRDRDVITTPDDFWVSTVGNTGTDTSYVVMQGTSMATPVASGGATLLLSKSPTLSPQELYNTIAQGATVDGFTGSVPNNSWGNGKLNVNAAVILLTDAHNVAGLPTTFSLSQNFPNPFNPTTTIRYAVARRGHVVLALYNTLGQLVATLVNEDLSAGTYDARFDGRSFASGVYFYRIQAGAFVQTKSLILLK